VRAPLLSPAAVETAVPQHPWNISYRCAVRVDPRIKGEAASRRGARTVQDHQSVPGVSVQSHVGLRGQLEAAVLARDNDSGSG